MDYPKCRTLLQYDQIDVVNIRNEFGLNNLTLLNNYLDSIIEWFSKEAHLNHCTIDRDMIERVMILARGSLERTKHMIESQYFWRNLMPEILDQRDTKSEQFNNFWKFSSHILLPRLYNGGRIELIQFNENTSDIYDYTLTLKMAFVLGDVRLKYDYSNGGIIIIDLKNTTFTHLTKVNLFLMKKAQHLFNEAYNMRIIGIHVINAPSFVDKLLFLVKQAIKPKIIERIYIHDNINDLNKHIPVEYLPQDYGGHQPTLHKLKEQWREELQSEDIRNYLIELSNSKADVSKRLDKNTKDNLEGTFKKIEFD